MVVPTRLAMSTCRAERPRRAEAVGFDKRGAKLSHCCLTRHARSRGGEMRSSFAREAASRISNWWLGALFAVILVACAPARPAASPLAIGTSGDYAPFSSRDGAGGLSGFDIELAEQLGRDLGREI